MPKGLMNRFNGIATRRCAGGRLVLDVNEIGPTGVVAGKSQPSVALQMFLVAISRFSR